MLIPKEKKREYPAIIILHGHSETNAFCIKERFELTDPLVRRGGFILISPQFRAMNADMEEYYITRRLMSNGFTLMGMRVYEFLLVVKYLRYLKEIDHSRIGLLGHSGGSVVANLGVRLTDAINAEVKDWDSNYLESGHCEDVPILYPYVKVINDEKTLPIPVLKMPYYLKDYNGRKKIIKFFLKHLKLNIK